MWKYLLNTHTHTHIIYYILCIHVAAECNDEARNSVFNGGFGTRLYRCGLFCFVLLFSNAVNTIRMARNTCTPAHLRTLHLINECQSNTSKRQNPISAHSVYAACHPWGMLQAPAHFSLFGWWSPIQQRGRAVGGAEIHNTCVIMSFQ